MVTLNNSGTDQRIPLRKLTLYNAAPQHVQRHSELKKKPKPPPGTRSLTMPKVSLNQQVPDEEEASTDLLIQQEARPMSML